MGSPSSRRTRRSPWPLLAWVGGMLLVFHPLLLSGFRQTPGGPRDARLVHYALEHAYRFFRQTPHHERFWDPPLFYPARNVAAYTDALLGQAPLYAAWRLLGAGPDRAFQLWELAVWTLNFLAFYLFLRRLFHLGPEAAATGAFLYAFGNPRLANVPHPQLLPQIYLLVAFYALFRLVEGAREGARRRRLLGYAVTAALALVAQAYSAFYPFFFVVLQLAVAVPAALLFREGRRAAGPLLRRAGLPAAVAVALGALLLLPFASHYGLAAQEMGPRQWSQVEALLPVPASWVLMARQNWLYGWVHDVLRELGIKLYNSPHTNGTGVVTLALAVAGLAIERRRMAVRLLVVVGLATVLGTTLFPGGFTLWRCVYDTVPGAGALRAVARVGQTLLLPFSVGLAFFCQRLLTGGRRRVALLLAVAVAAEQAGSADSFDRREMELRVATLVERIEPGCAVFYVSTPRVAWETIQIDAMWASLASGVPTINGSYGNAPPEWRLRGYRRRGRSSARLEAALLRWHEERCLRPEGTCWIQMESLAPPVGRTRPLRRGRRLPAPAAPAGCGLFGRCGGIDEPLGELAMEPGGPSELALGQGEAGSLSLRFLPRLRPPAGGCPPTAFVHLVDASGQTVRTFDHVPPAWYPGEPVRDRLPLFQSALAEPLPAGEYTLVGGLYDPGTGRRWRLDFAGQARAGRYRLATVRVPAAGNPPPFGFTGGWLAIEPGGTSQVPRRRPWRGSAAIELKAESPGRLWLQIEVIPRPPSEPQSEVRIAGSCAAAALRLGPGRHQVELPTAGPCTLELHGGPPLPYPGTDVPRSANLEALTWTPEDAPAG